jgi:glycosyltransferase involved in cell wall biosynthesis
MPDKPLIVFTLPNCMGGVASFNFNIINNSSLIQNFYSKVILLKSNEDKRPPFLDKFFVDEVILFEYSNKENQYYVQKRLNQLIGNEDGALVTDNVLTLSAADRFNNPKTIFHLVHDYFYVNQNIAFGDKIDVAVAHSSFFSDAVFASNPTDFSDRCFYIPYGVKEGLTPVKQNNSGKLNLVFLGRLDEGKGVHCLFEIEQLLLKENIQVCWTIIGKGPQKKNLRTQWKNKQNILFFEPDTADEVYKILERQDVFVFPTSFEGTPVSILECLANGVVTITNDLPGGIRDIVTKGIGFRCKLNDLDEFVKKIVLLNNDRILLKQMQFSCFELFKKSFDISNNADSYFNLFLQFHSFKRKVKNHKTVPMSRLDGKYFPNFVTKSFRSLKWSNIL